MRAGAAAHSTPIHRPLLALSSKPWARPVVTGRQASGILARLRRSRWKHHGAQQEQRSGEEGKGHRTLVPGQWGSRGTGEAYHRVSDNGGSGHKAHNATYGVAQSLTQMRRERCRAWLWDGGSLVVTLFCTILRLSCDAANSTSVAVKICLDKQA
ncbi:hypothetical protein BS78_03G379000 [Paspalum vaginatum]|nr:hypothetical protein BS78_03G379000 [Paspalum vaginatum]